MLQLLLVEQLLLVSPVVSPMPVRFDKRYDAILKHIGDKILDAEVHYSKPAQECSIMQKMIETNRIHQLQQQQLDHQKQMERIRAKNDHKKD